VLLGEHPFLLVFVAPTPQVDFLLAFGPASSTWSCFSAPALPAWEGGCEAASSCLLLAGEAALFLQVPPLCQDQSSPVTHATRYVPRPAVTLSLPARTGSGLLPFTAVSLQSNSVHPNTVLWGSWIQPLARRRKKQRWHSKYFGLNGKRIPGQVPSDPWASLDAPGIWERTALFSCQAMLFHSDTHQGFVSRHLGTVSRSCEPCHHLL